MKIMQLAAALSILAAPAVAAGDAAAGEKAFGRQCVSCHVVKNEAGDTLAGRNARTGPNLYRMTERQPGTVEGFRYGKDLVEAGTKLTVWDEANFVAYIQDPTGWVREASGNARARSKMSYKVRSEQDAQDIYAYLAGLK